MNSTINLIFANASGTLNPHKATIQSAFNDAVAICTKQIGINKVDVIVVADKANSIPEVGVGGYTPNRHLTYVYIDATHPVSASEVFNTICHELHHARRYDGPGFGVTLFDSLVFEGLACCYEKEVQNSQSYFLRTIAEYTNAHKLIAENNSKFASKDFNYREWFITGNTKLPRWAGYIMGYQIVNDYLQKINSKASELTLINPNTIYNSLSGDN